MNNNNDEFLFNVPVKPRSQDFWDEFSTIVTRQRNSRKRLFDIVKDALKRDLFK